MSNYNYLDLLDLALVQSQAVILFTLDTFCSLSGFG